MTTHYLDTEHGYIINREYLRKIFCFHFAKDAIWYFPFKWKADFTEQFKQPDLRIIYLLV